MRGEFCRVLTGDGLELQGMLVTPKGGAADTTVIHTHGLDGNFYENRFIDHVADACIETGFNFITTNNRGHDYISDFICAVPGSGELSYRQIGGMYEVFEESVLDIAAWVDFARSRGSTKFIIQGHSHGALKSIYYLYRAGAPDVVGLVLLSPSDDFGKQRAALGDGFNGALALAEGLIGKEKELDLMPPEMFHYPISARSYFDIYKPDSPLALFNVSRTDRDEFPELAGVEVPVLMIVGSVDEAFLGEPDEFLEATRELLPNAASFRGIVLRGAPHNYLGFDAEVGASVGTWLKNTFS